MGEFAWSTLAAPYAALVVALVALGLTALLIRGDAVLRLALIGAVSNTLPWAVTSALAACTTDPDTATRLLRVGNGPVALLGSSLMLLILGAYGQTERYRRLLIGASVAGTLSLAMCWTTELVIPGVRLTPSGMLYPRAGPLTIVHAGQLALWPVLGLAIVRRTAGDQPPRMRPWQLITLVAFVVAATADVLLAHGIAGYYPFAWLPALGAVALCFHLILRSDLIRARGFDTSAAIELAIVLPAAGAVALVVATLHARGVHPLLISAAAAPVAVVAGATASHVRARRAAISSERDDADRLDHMLQAARDRPAIAQAIDKAWRRAGCTDVTLWHADQGALRAGDRHHALDPVLRDWLVAHPGLIVRGDLLTSHLAGARAEVEALARVCGPDVVLPLVDRDQVLGVIGARYGTAGVLRDRERVSLEETATPAARALAYLALRREAEAAASAARDSELAEAVANQASSRRRADLGNWRLAAAYRAAERVAGDVWTWEHMPDGRLALLVADVAGRGVPAALVSAALAGAFTAAVAGGGVDATTLADRLHRTIVALGHGRGHAAAFVAICDAERGVIDWVSAGHRGGCVIRPVGGGADPELAVLAGPSTTLGADGERASGRVPLVPGELLIVVSDGVIGLRDAKGQAWGERRFAQILRGGALAAGDQAAPLILEAALAHAGGMAPSDDLLVIAVEPS